MNGWVAALLAVGTLTGCGLLARYVQPRVIAWEMRKRAERKHQKSNLPGGSE